MNIKDYRQKLYYPKDQIVNDLFTNGREFMLLRNFEEYIGFYHRYTTGEVFTENEWNPLKSERLIRFRTLTEPQKKYYDIKLFSKNITKPGIRRKKSNNNDEYFRFSAPRPVKRKLTQSEIDSGTTYRYFITKRNERDRVFYEVSSEQGVSFFDNKNGINQYLYELIQIPWKVDGPEYDIYDGDLLKIPGVIDTNLRILDRFSNRYPILRQVLRNPRELTVYENASIRTVTTKTTYQTQSPPVAEIPELPIPSDEDTKTPGFGLIDNGSANNMPI